MNRIVIHGIPNDLSRLIGFELGQHVYQQNKLDELDLTQKNEIVFPDTITKISSSFVQGFFYGFIQKIGKNSAKERIVIQMRDKELTDLFYKKLY